MQKIIWLKACRESGWESDQCKRKRGTANTTKLDNNLSRAKAAVKEFKPVLDLRENHTSEINIQDLEDDIDDDIELENPDDDNINEEDEGDYYDTIDDMDDDDSDDDLKDLVIVDEGYDDDSDL